MNVTDKLKNPPKPKRLRDYVAILLDASGSIADRHFTDQMFDALLEQDKNLRELAKDPERDVVFKYSLFGPLVTSLPVGVTPTRDNYNPYGGTNYYGAIAQAVEEFSVYDDGSPETSFLVVGITDGEHNRRYICEGRSVYDYDAQPIKNLIEKKTARGNWTFVSIVPEGFEEGSKKIGIPAGNISSFDVNKSSDYAKMSGQTVAATQSYSTLRTSGVRQTKTFFTDASKVSVAELTDVTADLKKYKVPREMRLDTLITYERGTFEKGKTYYQLTKPEKLAEGRDILLRDKSTKVIYGGTMKDVRQKIGLPPGDIRVKPGNHAGFDIFVLSKSDNRLLVRGTDVLYRQ